MTNLGWHIKMQENAIDFWFCLKKLMHSFKFEINLFGLLGQNDCFPRGPTLLRVGWVWQWCFRNIRKLFVCRQISRAGKNKVQLCETWWLSG